MQIDTITVQIKCSAPTDDQIKASGDAMYNYWVQATDVPPPWPQDNHAWGTLFKAGLSACKFIAE